MLHSGIVWLLVLVNYVNLQKSGKSDKYENIALHKPSFQSSTFKNYHAQNANVDKSIACAITEKEDDPWWIVAFDTFYLVEHVVMTTKMAERNIVPVVINLDIIVGMHLMDVTTGILNQTYVCTKLTAHVLNETEVLYCEEPLVTRALKVKVKSPQISLVLCDIKVIGFSLADDNCTQNANMTYQKPSQKDLRNLRKQNRMDKKTFTSYTRKLSSATDTRMSSRLAGLVATTIMVIILCSIILADARHIHMAVKNMRKYFLRKRKKKAITKYNNNEAQQKHPSERHKSTPNLPSEVT